MKLVGARKAKGLTITELHQTSGVDRATIRSIEKGAAIPYLRTRETLCTALAVTPDNIDEFSAPTRLLRDKQIGEPCPCGCGGVYSLSKNVNDYKLLNAWCEIEICYQSSKVANSNG